MRTATLACVVSVFVVLASAPGVVRADLAPPNECTSPGQPCQTAGTQYNQAGTCVATTCTKSVPNSDGGRTPMSYACDLCQAAGAAGSNGAAGANAAAGSNGAAGTRGAAGSNGGVHTGGGGCSVAPVDDGPGGWALIVALGALGLAAALRRRHASV
jgi:MYXO-CTERM domain-containing protein